MIRSLPSSGGEGWTFGSISIGATSDATTPRDGVWPMTMPSTRPEHKLTNATNPMALRFMESPPYGKK
jgi:hypothetical protein